MQKYKCSECAEMFSSEPSDNLKCPKCGSDKVGVNNDPKSNDSKFDINDHLDKKDKDCCGGGCCGNDCSGDECCGGKCCEKDCTGDKCCEDGCC